MKIRARLSAPVKFNGLLIPLLFILLSSCFNESKVDLAKPSTFVRSYSNGYPIKTVQVEQTPEGGFIILGNTEVRNSEAEAIQYKIVLVKTDQYGNELDMVHYPAIDDNSRNLSASSILLVSGGYLISGAEIQGVDVNTGEITQYDPLLMEVDETTYNASDFTYPGSFNSRAMAATIDQSDNSYLVLFSSEDLTASMAVSSISPTAFTVNWSRSYSGNQAVLANRIFYEATPEFIYFGGTATFSNKNDGRLVKVKVDEANTEFDIPYKADALIESDETIVDLCRFGSGFALIGKTTVNGNDDILYFKLSASGSAPDTAVFVAEILEDKDFKDNDRRTEFETNLNTKNETGKSISPVSDGGLIILATIDSYGDPIPLGAGNTDMLLMKINAFGERQWTRTLGGLDADDGTCVRQTTDGGFIVLGTSRLGARETILLVKTDQLGDVD